MRLFSVLMLGILVFGCSDDPVPVNSGERMGGTPGQGGNVGVNMTCSFDGMAFPLGTTRCENGEVYVCSSLGLWMNGGVTPECEVTIDRCTEARQTNSYIGCEYCPWIWTLPLKLQAYQSMEDVAIIKGWLCGLTYPFVSARVRIVLSRDYAMPDNAQMGFHVM